MPRLERQSVCGVCNTCCRSIWLVAFAVGWLAENETPWLKNFLIEQFIRQLWREYE
jgi:hypothetical protein